MVMEVCFATSFSCVFAAKDGSGGGPGPSAKLKLEQCNVYDGMEDAETNLNIEMKFTKNVADLTVQENNEQAISLKTKTGEDADYEVYFPEEFAKRQYIEINAELQPNTQYVLSLDTTLMARNGINYLSKDYEINFTTGDETVAKTDNEQQENTTNKIQKDNKNTQEKIKNNISYLYYFLLLAVVAILVLVKKRGNKNV